MTDTKRRMCGDRIADLEVAFDEPGTVRGKQMLEKIIPSSKIV